MRLGLHVNRDGCRHIKDVVAATGKFPPETKVVAGGDGWTAVAAFGVGGGSIFVTSVEAPTGVELVFIPGHAGVKVRLEHSYDGSTIPLWEIAKLEEPKRVTDPTDANVAIRGHAEFADDELMGIYTVYVRGVAVFEVSQAIGEEYWRGFDQEVFKSAAS